MSGFLLIQSFMQRKLVKITTTRAFRAFTAHVANGTNVCQTKSTKKHLTRLYEQKDRSHKIGKFSSQRNAFINRICKMSGRVENVLMFYLS